MDRLTIQQAEETMGRVGIKSWLKQRFMDEDYIEYYDTNELFKSNMKMQCSVAVWVKENIMELSLEIYPTMRWKKARVSYSDRNDLLNKLPKSFPDLMIFMKRQSALECCDDKLSNSIKSKLESAKMEESAVDAYKLIPRLVRSDAFHKAPYPAAAATILAKWYNGQGVTQEKIDSMSDKEFIENVFYMLDAADDNIETHSVYGALGMT